MKANFRGFVKVLPSGIVAVDHSWEYAGIVNPLPRV